MLSDQARSDVKCLVEQQLGKPGRACVNGCGMNCASDRQAPRAWQIAAAWLVESCRCDEAHELEEGFARWPRGDRRGRKEKKNNGR